MARERANSIYEYLRYDTKNRMFVDFFWGSLEKVAKCTVQRYCMYFSYLDKLVTVQLERHVVARDIKKRRQRDQGVMKKNEREIMRENDIEKVRR